MGESFSKKDKANKKKKDKQDKAQKMLDRKTNNNKGKDLEDMLAYVDENGNLSSTPPNAAARKEIALEDIRLGAAPIEPEETVRKGRVSHYNDAKGYGFITDEKTGEDVFFHSNQLSQPVKEKDRVSFEKERTPRGYSAVNVQKITA
jgi:cold shock CspA family protein